MSRNSLATILALGAGVLAIGCSALLGFEEATYLEVDAAVPDQPPSARDDMLLVDEDSAATTIVVTANDLNADGGPLVIEMVTDPANGTATKAGPTQITYQPNPNYCSTTPDTFAYRLNGGTIGNVRAVVACVNDAPTFTPAFGTGTAPEDGGPRGANWATMISPGPPNEASQTITFEVTSNSNPSLFVTGPIVTPAGSLEFTSAPNATGSATITVRARDSGGTAKGVNVSTPQAVRIDVMPIDDPPEATDESYFIVIDAGPQAIDVLANDVDPDSALQIVSATDPAHGTVIITGGGTGLTYQPDPGYSGPDYFTYAISATENADVLLSVRPSLTFCTADIDFAAVVRTPVTTFEMTPDTVFTNTGDQSCRAGTGKDTVFALSIPVPLDRIQIDTFGSTFNTVLSLRDTTCTELTFTNGSAICNDDVGATMQAGIAILNATAGDAAIVVDSVGATSGTIVLNVSGTVAAGTACTDPLFAAGVLACTMGTTCVSGTCQ